MDDVILVILGATLGVLATLLTQFISRRQKLADAERQEKRNYLDLIVQWMEAYRKLFNCQYPEGINALLFAHQYLVPHLGYDETAAVRVYEALKEYRTAKAQYEDAERHGVAAVLALHRADQSRAHQFIARSIWIVTHRRPVPHYTIGAEKSLLYPARGFVAAVVPHLVRLNELRRSLFELFPARFLSSVDWQMLDHIEVDKVHSIIDTTIPRYPSLYDYDPDDVFRWQEDWNKHHQQYAESEWRLADARDNRPERKEAVQEIDLVLRKVEIWKEKWLSPV